MKRKKKRSKYSENINKRILIYLVIVILLFMVIILRLFQVMIIDNKKYKNKLETNSQLKTYTNITISIKITIPISIFSPQIKFFLQLF